MSDGQLVRRARAGDREAFGELVNRYRDMAYGLGYHLTGEFEAARDLAQEGFVQAYLKLSQLRDPERFAAWLRRIVVNVHRMNCRGKEVTTVALDEATSASAQESRPTEIELVVREALSKLGERERLALTLHYINGYSHAEIGGFLGIRPETVKTRLARARQHLREEVMAMVEDTFEKRKLPDDFTEETIAAALASAEEHLKQGRVGAALGEYEVILQRDADHVPALLGMGMAQQAAGQDDEAVRRFRRVLELDPANQLAYGHLCQILGDQRDRFQELIALEEEQLRRHPEKAFQLHLSLGGIYTAVQQCAEAESHLQRARDLEPSSPYPLDKLGHVLAFQGRYDEAESLLKEAAASLARGFRNPVAEEWNLLQLAFIRCAAGRYEQAIETVRPVFLGESESRADRIVERCLHVVERCHHYLSRLDVFPNFCRHLREQMPLRSRADRLTWYLGLFLESRLLRDQALAEYQRLGAIPAHWWRVAVPFDNQHGRGMAAVYPPEEHVALDDPDVGKDGRHIRWQRPWSEGLGYEMDFVRQIEVNVFLFEWALGYAVLEIVSPKKQDAVFRFGASGWCQVWLNGESLVLDRVFTGVPDAASVPMKLKRGRNELLMKIGVQQAGPTMRGEYYYWSLFSRITDTAGDPIRDLRFPLGN